MTAVDVQIRTNQIWETNFQTEGMEPSQLKQVRVRIRNVIPFDHQPDKVYYEYVNFNKMDSKREDEFRKGMRYVHQCS